MLLRHPRHPRHLPVHHQAHPCREKDFNKGKNYWEVGPNEPLDGASHPGVPLSAMNEPTKREGKSQESVHIEACKRMGFTRLRP